MINQLFAKRDSDGNRLLRLLRSIWWWMPLILLVYSMWSSQAVFNGVILVAGYVLRLAFVLVFAIMQFVAIFWFMAQSKVEVIKPEDAKSVSFGSYWGQPTLLKLIKQWVHLLSDRKQFVKMGGTYINGLLLYGPPGCLSGNAVIEINRGGKSFKIALKDLVHRFNGGSIQRAKQKTPIFWNPDIPTTIRSRDERGSIRLIKILSAVHSGKKKTYTLKTQGGRTLRGTADHRILGLHGWKTFGELQKDDVILVDGGQSNGREHLKPRYRMRSGLKGHPYANHKRKWGYEVPEHRLVAEANINDLGLDEYMGRLKKCDVSGLSFLNPDEFHVHHIDSDTANNAIENLEVLEPSEHYRMEATGYKWRYVVATTIPDKVESVEIYGDEDTYDLTVDGDNKNFLAEGIVVHNSGKTLLAKALAGESNIPFISIEGSGFRAMFVGVDVLKMMWFCSKAKKLAREYGASVAFIDEIDSVGMSRGGVMGGQGQMMGGFMGMGGGTGALTRLLYELDGIGETGRWEKFIGRIYSLFGKKIPQRNWHVLYIGATNRPDVLDPALLRPGRFDQKIVVDAPDKAGRREIITGYLGKIKHDETVDIEAIVEDTPHATPAMIASSITKHAVRIALFNGRDVVSQQDIDLALQEQRMGIEQPIEEWDAKQRKQVAYHESGHAVVQHYLLPEQRIVRVSIIRRGGALGYMMPVDRVEVYAMPLKRLAASIMVAMAGHVATKIFMGEHWTGASSDFSAIRRSIWALYSLGYFGPPVMGHETGSQDNIPSEAHPLLERFWNTLEEQTEKVLKQHKDEVDAVAKALLEKNDLSNTEVLAFLGDNGYRII